MTSVSNLKLERKKKRLANEPPNDQKKRSNEDQKKRSNEDQREIKESKIKQQVDSLKK